MADQDWDKEAGSSINSELRPPSRMVNEFHANDDVNRDADAHHHTIGTGPNEAASGSHNHDGANSVQLLAGKTITGSRSSGSALISVITMLTDLGAEDGTTA